MENRKAYFSDIYSVLLPETKNGKIIYFTKLGMYPEEAYTESYSGEFGSNGDWDVSLTVLDGLGQSDTRRVRNMVVTDPGR